MKTYILKETSEMEAIINECPICFVGLNDNGKNPYVFPMNFAYNDGEIILHSAPSGRHQELIAQNNRVTVTFCSGNKLVYQHPEVACSYRMDSKSVICTGSVNFIENLQEKERYLNLIMQKYTGKDFKYSNPALSNVKVWKIKIETMTARAFGQKHRR